MTQCTAINLLPTSEFDPENDEEVLQMALEVGDRVAIAYILGHRGIAQRVKIAQKFQIKYNSSLSSYLEEKLQKSCFRNLVLALITPPDEFIAKELHDTMDGLGTEDDTLVASSWLPAMRTGSPFMTLTQEVRFILCV